MRTTIDDKGNIRINGVSFMEFNKGLWGYDVISKRTNQKVPRFILFWKGFSIATVKDRYILKERN